MSLKSGCLIFLVFFVLLVVVSFPSLIEALKEDDDFQCFDCPYYKTLVKGYVLSAMDDMRYMVVSKKEDNIGHVLVTPTVTEVSYNEKYIFAHSTPIRSPYHADTTRKKLYHIIEIGTAKVSDFSDFKKFQQKKDSLCNACILKNLSEKDWKK